MLEIKEYKPKGIEKAINILQKAINTPNKKFLVYYDPDIDGLVAGYLAEELLKLLGKDEEVEYIINENRTHGFLIEDLEKYKDYFILAVDFGITREEIKKIVDSGIDIVSIDHHEIEDELIEYENQGYQGIVINNQYPFEPEEQRFLSGGGMVYYFMRAVLGKMTRQLDYESLAGISLLSDVRVTESLEARAFLERTFNNNSAFFQYLINLTKGEYLSSEKAQRYSGFGKLDRMYRNYVDFIFSPKFNALFRLNKGEDAIELLKINPEIVKKYMTNFELDKVKDKQNEIRDLIIEHLTGQEYSNLNVKGLTSNFSIEGDFKLSNFIGVACSKIKDNYKTTLVYKESKENYIERGSVRGLYDEVDYLSIFQSEGFNAAGHKGAFGVLDTDLSNINWESLNAKIKKAEEEVSKNLQALKKIVKINNLSTYMNNETYKKIPEYNSFVRSQNRIYLKYTGNNYTKRLLGKLILYTVDNIKVKCFDEDITMENGYILPMIEKGGYIEYTLNRI